MKEPKHYTVPEQFISDNSVPAHWRVYVLINGFFINHLPFYGSNKWITDKLGCSEPTVTKAFSTLEKMGLITIERTKRSRIVHKNYKKVAQKEDPTLPRSEWPWVEVGSETQVDFGRDPSELWSGDPSELGPNAEINAEREIDAVASIKSPFFIVKEDSEGKEKTKVLRSKNPAWPVFLSLRDLLSKDAGFEIQTGAWDLKATERAIKFLGTPEKVKDMLEDLIANTNVQKLNYSLSKCLSAGNLNRYKSENS